MSYGDWLFAERVMDLRVEEEQRSARDRRQRRQAKDEGEAAGFQWIHRTGGVLVRLGRRLEQYGLPQVPSLEQQAESGR